MSTTHLLLFIVAFIVLMVASFITYQYQERRIKKRIEDEMEEWIKTEFLPNVTQANRRGGRAGGRRKADQVIDKMLKK